QVDRLVLLTDLTGFIDDRVVGDAPARLSIARDRRILNFRDAAFSGAVAISRRQLRLAIRRCGRSSRLARRHVSLTGGTGIGPGGGVGCGIGSGSGPGNGSGAGPGLPEQCIMLPSKFWQEPDQQSTWMPACG